MSLRWAEKHARVLFTHDLDFGAILAATNAAGPSVLQRRDEDPLPEAHAQLVLHAPCQFEVELTGGALVSIEPGRARARVLPLGS